MLERITSKQNTKKYILTGGPGVGKSTVIEILKKMNLYTIPEAARIIIDEQLANSGSILPWKDKNQFEQKVLDLKIESELSIPQNTDVAFLDRGIPDSLAFYLENQNPNKLPRQFIESAYSNSFRYDQIFLLDQIPSYHQDKTRRESPERARKLHEAIARTYSELGYKIARIPYMKPEERVKLILNHIS
jgi:predicted ATPase